MSSMSINLLRMATKTLTREGQTCELRFKDVNGAYDPNTGTNVRLPDDVRTVKIAFLGYSNLSNGLAADKNSVIEAYNNVVYISARDTSGNVYPRTPSPSGDVIIDSSGTEWRIVLIKEYNPSGSQTIMYEALVSS